MNSHIAGGFGGSIGVLTGMDQFNFRETYHLQKAEYMTFLGSGTFGQNAIFTCKSDCTGGTCNKMFVVKRLVYTDKGRAIKKFNQEFNIGVHLHHKNIRKTFDFDHISNCILFEYCSGIDLFEYATKSVSNCTRELVTLYDQILQAVCYLHNLGIAHLDLKLENIIIDTSTREIKLIDFGEAVQFKILGKDKELLFSGHRGTVQYMAPESIDSINFSAPKCDVWSCGIMLYNLLYNKTPWNVANAQRDDRYKIHKSFARMERLTPFFFKPLQYSDREWKIISYLFRKMLHPLPEKRISIHMSESIFKLTGLTSTRNPTDDTNLTDETTNTTDEKQDKLKTLKKQKPSWVMKLYNIYKVLMNG